MASTTKDKKPVNTDLSDSPDDQKHMQPDKGTLNLPDVKDIPGQEHVRPMPAGEMADTTISSSDEEGEGLFDDDETLGTNTDTNVSSIERELLDQSSQSMATADDQALRQAKVDKLDEEGEPLNEGVDQTGSDLDVPGSESDEGLESTGESDEENNSFSLNDDKEDPVNTRQ